MLVELQIAMVVLIGTKVFALTLHLVVKIVLLMESLHHNINLLMELQCQDQGTKWD